jgi:hypothetical protein
LNQARYEGRIVPLLHRACDPNQLSWTLPQMQMVSFLGEFDGGSRELLRVRNMRFRAGERRPADG